MDKQHIVHCTGNKLFRVKNCRHCQNSRQTYWEPRSGHESWPGSNLHLLFLLLAPSTSYSAPSTFSTSYSACNTWQYTPPSPIILLVILTSLDLCRVDLSEAFPTARPPPSHCPMYAGQWQCRGWRVLAKYMELLPDAESTLQFLSACISCLKPDSSHIPPGLLAPGRQVCF